MTYEDFLGALVKVIEGVGAGILVVGGLVAFARYAWQVAAQRVQRERVQPAATEVRARPPSWGRK